MIINFPTGLYRSILPKSPSDPRSVTFTISGGPPPRTGLNYIQLPYAAQQLGLAPNNNRRNRAALGDLSFIVSGSSLSLAAGGSKTTEIGQVLEFGDEPIIAPTPSITSENLETRHDLSYLNLAGVGLTATEVVEALRVSQEKYDSVIASLNTAKTARADLDVQISSIRGRLAEASKASKALTLAGLGTLAAKVNDTMATLMASLTAKIAEAEALNTTLVNLTKQVEDLRALVQ